MSAEVAAKMDVSPPSAPSAQDFKAGLEKAKAHLEQATPSGGFLGGGASREFKEQLNELAAWDQPYNSFVALAVVSAVYYLTSGPEAYSLVTLVCMALVVRLLVIAGARKAQAGLETNEKAKSLQSLIERFALSVEAILVVPSPSDVKNVVHGAADLIERRVNKICKAIVEATEPTPEGSAKLKTVLAHVFGLMLALYFFSLWTLLYLHVVYMMVWPITYSRYHEQIDKVADQVKTKTEPAVELAKEKLLVVLKIAEEKGIVLLQAAAAKAGELANKATAMQQAQAGSDSAEHKAEGKEE